MNTTSKPGAVGAHSAPDISDQQNSPAPTRRSPLDAATVVSIFARIAVAAVFIANVMCAVQFVVAPAASAAAYGLATDYATQAIVSGLGVAFLMWNCTYPAVIASPVRFKGLYALVLVQQLVGLVGESAIRIRLVAQGMHDSLMIAGIDQFILWDAGGLLVMGVAFIALMAALRRRG